MQDKRKKRALITGITGQDGAYLAEFLLGEGLRGARHQAPRVAVQHGPHRPPLPGSARADRRLILHYGDLTDATNLIRIVQEVQPDEIYNLAAQSHVAVSFETPEYTANSDALGTLRLLEAIRILRPQQNDALLPGVDARRCSARCRRRRRRETTPFYPRSPYGVAKVYAYWITVNYREAYGMYACNGILFNHESPHARRDVRHAQDHARPRAHQGRPRGVPLPRQPRRAARLGPRARLRASAVADAAAGQAGGLRDRDRRAALGARVRRARRGRARHRARLARHGRRRARRSTRPPAARVVRVDPRYFRPTEVETLLGDASKARAKLGWRPEIGFDAARPRDGRRGPEDSRERDALVAREGFARRPATANEPRCGHLRRGPPRPGRLGDRAARSRTRATRNLAERAAHELDLRDQAAVERFFASERPEYVFLAAAKVGGILANNTYPADFIRDNLLIQTNVIDAAYRARRAQALLPRLELHLPAARAAADAARTRCSPARSSRRTSGTRSRRSPASRCARRTRGSTASTRSR